MKAIIQYKYGSPDVLELEEVDKPIVKDDHVLVRFQAASVNPLDWHFMRGAPRIGRLATGLFKPRKKILGADVAGRVEAVGRKVTKFQPGDEVLGGTYESGLGAFAEYVCVTESACMLKPANMTFEEAAAVPTAAFTALLGLRREGKIQPGQTVLINGASGGVGSFAIQ
ncbi:MAG: NAD(P)-dependent alcohol dehydrogenase, partial [Dehalococcoidia bacterium]